MITAEPSRKVKAKTESQIATGADVVVETLEAQGVTHVFGVPGAKIDKVFDRLRDSKIKTVVCRHEQNAAFIAGGIGRMSFLFLLLRSRTFVWSHLLKSTTSPA